MIWIEELGKAGKRLLRAPSYTAFTLICLGLGVGSTAAVFAVVDAFLLRPLPFEAPDRLLSVWKSFSYDQAAGLRYFLKPNDFAFARDRVEGSNLAAYLPGNVDVLGAGEPERLAAAKVSGDLFALLGLRPLAGRPIVADDQRLENAVAVVAEGWATRRFGDPAAALGKTLRVDGQPCEVVGVLPARLAFPDDTEIWVPLTPRELAGTLGFSVVARLAPGVEPGTAADEIRGLSRGLRELEPSLNANAGLDAEPLQVAITGSVRPALLALLAAGLGLLLIASANVGCLGLARARRRGREVGLRTTFGASRRRLVGESLAECLLLWLGSASSGLLLATLSAGSRSARRAPSRRSMGHPDPRSCERIQVFVGVEAGLYHSFEKGRFPSFLTPSVDSSESRAGAAAAPGVGALPGEGGGANGVYSLLGDGSFLALRFV